MGGNHSNVTTEAALTTPTAAAEMLRFSSWEGEEDQNAAWLWLNIFNKDDNVNKIQIQNKKPWKKPKQS